MAYAPSPRHGADASAVHFDRPIRPLPKRRLRNRIAPQEFESIPRPPAPEERLFSLPYYASPSRSISQSSSLEAQASSSNKGDQADVGKTSQAHSPAPLHQVQSAPVQSHGNSAGQKADPSGAPRILSNAQENASAGFQANQQSQASSGDSVDGYDSFENTNNKKKRKIPTNGGGHHSSLSSEMASMGLSTNKDTENFVSDVDSGIGHYYGTGHPAALAKPVVGRGLHSRLTSRRHSGRSPLRLSSNAVNYTRNGSAPLNEPVAQENQSPQTPDRNGTRDAIPSRTAATGSTVKLNKGPKTASKTAAEGGRTQFTFSCESDTGNAISWPSYGYSPIAGAYPTSVADGIDYTYDGVDPQSAQARSAMANQQADTNLQKGTGSYADSQRKPRRSLSKQYAMAAKDRRVRQKYTNYHHPPKQEDVWICEYCEYEAMFGTPPVALIRQYEIKDRRERRRLAEKQRLLDKAKMKGRRGKKGSKNSKQQNLGAPAPPLDHDSKKNYDLPGMDDYPLAQPDLQNDDYLLDEYDEDAVVTPPLPSSVHGPRSAVEIPRPNTGQAPKIRS